MLASAASLSAQCAMYHPAQPVPVGTSPLEAIAAPMLALIAIWTVPTPARQPSTALLELLRMGPGQVLSASNAVII